LKTDINILVVEDSSWFIDLLKTELKRCSEVLWIRENFRFIFHSYTDVTNVIPKLKIRSSKNSYSIAYLDYYLGQAINASHIIKLVKEHSPEAEIVLFSQSKNVADKVDRKLYDFFILKDESTPALCRLYLEQYLENKFSIPLDW